MIYKEEAPRRTVILQKGLVENGHCSNSNTLHENPVNAPIRADGKTIGYLRNHTFTKRVQGSKHMLKKPPAWCISKQAFIEKVMPHAKKIIVEDVESGRFYECLAEVFAKHAFEIQRGNFEPQLALTLNYWERYGNGHRQLSLWGESSA